MNFLPFSKVEGFWEFDLTSEVRKALIKKLCANTYGVVKYRRSVNIVQKITWHQSWSKQSVMPDSLHHGRWWASHPGDNSMSFFFWHFFYGGNWIRCLTYNLACHLCWATTVKASNKLFNMWIISSFLELIIFCGQICSDDFWKKIENVLITE